jgi:hypothetical protein
MQVIRRPERQKTALAAQKQRESVTKKVGRGGAVNLEQGKENCHVNNDRQESQQLEGQIFRPCCSPEPFGKRMRKIQIDQNWKIEDAPALALGESMKMTARRFVHPCRR